MPRPPRPSPRWLLLLAAVVLTAGGAALAVTAGRPEPVEEPVVASADFVLPGQLAQPEEPAECSGDTITDALEGIARRLAAQEIPYDSAALTDCSGMLHLVMTALEGRCPALDLPSTGEARTAAQLAAWFEDQHRLVPMPSPEVADRWLVPGTIAFFGKPGRLEVGTVVHVGVVVDVQREWDGEVLSYSMFHARQPGKVAGITHWHRRDARPALGNGRDALLAIAFPSPEVALAAPALGGEVVGSALGDAWSDRATD